jgi:ATP-dependent Clp protease protease subunit
MMYLNGEDKSKDMYLYINSLGGVVLARISIYDAMQFVVSDVHTICMGLAASMGSFILIGGEITKHITLPHTLCQCFFFAQLKDKCLRRMRGNSRMTYKP